MPLTRRLGTEKRKRKDLPYQLSSPATSEARPVQPGVHLSSLACHSQEEPIHKEGYKYSAEHERRPFSSGQLRARQSEASDTTAAHPKDSFLHQRPAHSQTEQSSAARERSASRTATETQYIANTKIPVDGWIQACRRCSTWTSALVAMKGRDVPVCRRCQRKFSDGSEDNSSASKGWSKSTSVLSAVSESLPADIQDLGQRQQICQQALQHLEDNWHKLVATGSAECHAS